MIPFFKRNDLIRSTITNEVYRCTSVDGEKYTFIGDESGRVQFSKDNLTTTFFQRFQIITEADYAQMQKGGAQ